LNGLLGEQFSFAIQIAVLFLLMTTVFLYVSFTNILKN